MPLVLVAPYKKTAIAEAIGLISNDYNYDHTTLLLHFAGTDGSNAFNDATGKTMPGTSTALLSTTQKKFGTASAKFTARTDVVQLPTSTQFTMTKDFTLEAWVRPTVLYAGSWGIFDFRTSGGTNSTYAFYLLNVGGVYRPSFFATSGINPTGTSTSVSLDVWTHVAVVRRNGVIRFFVNGVMDAVSFNSTALLTSGTNPILGSKDSNSASYGSVGYMDEVRITNGVGRYTTNFTVETERFENFGSDLNILNVTSLLHLNALPFTDLRGHTIINNNVALTTAGQDKFGGGSADFNTVSSSLTITADNSLVMGTGDFTQELWVYPRTNPTTQCTLWSNAPFIGSQHGLVTLGVHMLSDGKVRMQSYFNVFLTGTTALTLNTWSHIAISRASGVIRLHVNGVLQASSSTAYDFSYFNHIYLGNDRNGGTAGQNFNGRIDEWRLTKGFSRYGAADFVPAFNQFAES